MMYIIVLLNILHNAGIPRHEIYSNNQLVFLKHFATVLSNKLSVTIEPSSQERLHIYGV